jgi:hypothetical protein
MGAQYPDMSFYTNSLAEKCGTECVAGFAGTPMVSKSRWGYQRAGIERSAEEAARQRGRLKNNMRACVRCGKCGR